MKKFLFLIPLMLFLNFSCQKEINRRDSYINFFYWKSYYNYRDFEKMKNLGVKKCYMHIFDIVPDYLFKAKPINKADYIWCDLNLTPVIYIDNTTFYNLSEKDVLELAKNTDNLLANIRIYRRSEDIIITKVLVDCDWTEKTRDKYFLYLKELQKKKLTVETTIRLHQLTDKNMGIPPVDKGVLMIYNVKDIKNPNIKNSILELDVVEAYLKKMKKYPLHLDIALPVFSWAVVFRDSKIRTIVHSVDTLLTDTLSFLQKISSHKYKVVSGGYLKNTRVYVGEIIRVETPSPEQLEQVKQLIKEKFDYNQQIILFSYDQMDTNIFDSTAIVNIFKW